MTVGITPLILTTQRLSRLGSQSIVPPIQEPQKCARHDCATNDISQCDWDDRHVDELSNTEISTVEHADGDQEEIGDGVLVAECDTRHMSVVSPSEKTSNLQCPDRYPDTNNLREIVLAARRKINGQSDKPITPSSPRETVPPTNIDPHLSLRDRIR